MKIFAGISMIGLVCGVLVHEAHLSWLGAFCVYFGTVGTLLAIDGIVNKQ